MKKIKDYFSSSVIARLITAILLIVAVSNQQIGYYKFLRWCVFVTAIYVVYISYTIKKQMNFGVWLFGLIAILFNPIIPFFLGKELWRTTDLIIGIVFIGSTFIINEQGG